VADRWWLKRRTSFALTDQRALVKTRAIRERLLPADLRSTPSVAKSSRRDGIGTIAFGATKEGRWSNNGWTMWTVPVFSSVPVFFDIRDVDGVYKVVMEQRTAPRAG
jgi:hypothetical protein